MERDVSVTSWTYLRLRCGKLFLQFVNHYRVLSFTLFVPFVCFISSNSVELVPQGTCTRVDFTGSAGEHDGIGPKRHLKLAKNKQNSHRYPCIKSLIYERNYLS